MLNYDKLMVVLGYGIRWQLKLRFRIFVGTWIRLGKEREELYQAL